MQPGLSRAVPMAIIGFVLGALIVLILRGLQSMQPVWEPGVGLVLASFMCAGFFVWGMGAFDPKMSVHGEHAEEHHDEEADAAPSQILGGLTWQITTILIIAVLIMFALARFGGMTLTITGEPLASTTNIGMNPVVVADLAHLIILMITPIVLVIPLVLVILLAIVLLRPPTDGSKRSVRSWISRIVVILVLFGIGSLLAPLWFDTQSPLRGPPLDLALVTTNEAYSVGVTRWINENLVSFFGGATVIYVSQLVFFLGFLAFMIISLAIAGGLIAFAFFALSRGLKTTKADADAKAARAKAAASLPAGEAVAALPGGTTAEVELERPALWVQIVADVARFLAKIVRGSTAGLQ